MPRILRREPERCPVRRAGVRIQHPRRYVQAILCSGTTKSDVRGEGRRVCVVRRFPSGVPMSGAAHDTPREGIARTSMTLRCALSFATLLLVASANAADVLTSRGDDGRTGANLRETLLTI